MSRFNPNGMRDDPDFLIEQDKELKAFPELEHPDNQVCPGCGKVGLPCPNCSCVRPEDC